jgi:hypothetical protein
MLLDSKTPAMSDPRSSSCAWLRSWIGPASIAGLVSVSTFILLLCPCDRPAGSFYSASSMVSALYTINLNPDFTLALSASSLALTNGLQATTTLSVNGFNGFNGVTSFACSGLPAGATCAFSPTTLTGSGSTTLTISDPVSAMNTRPADSRYIALASLVALFACSRIRRRRISWLVLLFWAVSFFALNGCGGGGSGESRTGPVTKTYSVNVTGTSGTISHSASLTLTVTQ